MGRATPSSLQKVESGGELYSMDLRLPVFWALCLIVHL